jgi:CAAD domains of cyanobacterial aminoacyl-tRNA synthetase
MNTQVVIPQVEYMSTDFEDQTNFADAPSGTLSEDTSQEALDKAKQVASQVFGRLGEAPDYIFGIFNEYKRPITVIGLVVGALITVKTTFAVLGAINDIPVLSPMFELIGLLYSGWFIYRYLLKAETRSELVKSLTSTKDQILGKD